MSQGLILLWYIYIYFLLRQQVIFQITSHWSCLKEKSCMIWAKIATPNKKTLTISRAKHSTLPSSTFWGLSLMTFESESQNSWMVPSMNVLKDEVFFSFDPFEALKMLASLLQSPSTDDTTLAVACWEAQMKFSNQTRNTTEVFLIKN